ncbi:MAG TPA: polysaccharide biosynthesis tyrosine autokinase [Candidatus Mediterraneibacter faecavium]|uniref:Polysaccharide biosynthesis tyrosine autokinase n=1 Tax=Candidatus Mediterraneibacter faecavium TaxID=2838668 RepID=A0A9D2TLU9_9FIRM|nr:polysaccharide biosynthesis tyrosine autokinase [Candidatus Mediterraneibacter faecavium]
MNRELFRFDEISIRGLCMDLLRNAWMILIAGISLWFLATGWHNLTYEPQYTSSATLVVTLKGESNTYSSLSLATQMADVFSQVFQSDVLRERIVEDTGEDIHGTISCTPVTETNLMVLSATCSDPRQAYLYINSALRHYEDVAGDVFSNSALQIVQDPEVPSAPSNTSWALSHRYLLAGLAMIAMAGVICLFYLLRFTVKTPACGARQLDGKIRGTIPYEAKGGAFELFDSLGIGAAEDTLRGAGSRRKSAGKSRKGKRNGKENGREKRSLLLNSPLVTMGFAEATRRVEARVEYHLRKKKEQVLLVTSVMENEGKSTVAANLALALAEKHRKVLLIDGDLLKPAMHKLFEEQKGDAVSLAEALEGKTEGKTMIRYDEKHKFWKLFQYRAAEDPASILDGVKLQAWMDAWKRELDYIIVDCSPVSVSSDAEVWMNVVDSVLLVVREDRADVRMINDAVDAVWQSGKDFAGFILNAFHKEWFQGISEGGYSSYRYGNYAYGNSRKSDAQSTEERG